MYDDELLDRNLHPRFQGKLEVLPIKLVNSSCGDEIEIFLKVVNGKIVDARWQGKGCAISLASADFFAESVINKRFKEALKLREEFENMILGEKYNEELLGKVKALGCVSRMPARAKCAKLAWESLEKIA